MNGFPFTFANGLVLLLGMVLLVVKFSDAFRLLGAVRFWFVVIFVVALVIFNDLVALAMSLDAVSFPAKAVNTDNARSTDRTDIPNPRDFLIYLPSLNYILSAYPDLNFSHKWMALNEK